jgi:hypothetical protein
MIAAARFSIRRAAKRGAVCPLTALILATISGVIANPPNLVFSQSRRFGRTIAGITVGQDNLDKVRSLYGPGAENIVTNVRTLCYHFEQERAYLSAGTFEGQNRIRSVLLTTFSSVDPGCHDTKVSGKHLLTGPDGIQLGDSMQRVTAAVGTPSKTGKLPVGPRKLLYGEYALAGGHATCQFESDKLILIDVEPMNKWA